MQMLVSNLARQQILWERDCIKLVQMLIGSLVRQPKLAAGCYSQVEWGLSKTASLEVEVGEGEKGCIGWQQMAVAV